MAGSDIDLPSAGDERFEWGRREGQGEARAFLPFDISQKGEVKASNPALPLPHFSARLHSARGVAFRGRSMNY